MTAQPALRLGTRKSPMAVAQSQLVARLITERTGREVELAGVTMFGEAQTSGSAAPGREVSGW